jgi:hypothetical protein
VAQLQESGLKLTLEDFNTFMAGMKMANLGMAEMAKAIANVSKQAGAAAPGFDRTASATDGMGKALGIATKGFTSAAGSVGSIVSALGGPAGLVVGIGAAAIAFTSIKKTVEAFAQTVQRAVQGLVQFGQQGLMLASRFRQTENSAIAVGRAFGIADDDTRAAIDTIADAGIRYDIAANSALQLIRNQIDLAASTELVKIAQATGIIVGEDSSATMGRLTHAIATGNTAMLGYMNITVTKNDIEREAQELYGRSVDMLSAQEKMQARVNAIIEASVPIMGVYEASMDSAVKALGSLTGRELPTLGATMMQVFEPAFKTAVETVRTLVKTLTAAMDEGGSLYPILVNLGAAASLVADGFKAAADFIANWIKGLQVNVSDGAASTIELMARWGIEMIAVFAQAIIEAAAVYLTAAMRFVSSILTFWMAPGSPPRIAPEIDVWGAETINEWLHGMTKADFNILTDIQSTISKFLSGPELLGATAELTGFLAGERKLGEDFFKRIGEAAGFMGGEVIKLTKAQLALAQATEMIEMAERRLEESRRAVADAQDRTTALTKEYNQLLREGAPSEILEAKLDEINASEEQIDLAQAQVKEAEAAKEEVEGVLDPLKEQVELQKLLIAQLEKMTAQQEELAAGAGGGAAAGGVGGAAGAGLGIPELPIPDATMMGEEITNRISIAVEKAKKLLKQKLKELFEPLREAWENAQKPIGQLKESFQGVLRALALAILKVNNIFAKFIGEFLEGIGTIIDAMIGISEALGIPTDDLQNFRDNTINPLIERFEVIQEETDEALRRAQKFGSGLPKAAVSAFKSNMKGLSSTFKETSDNAQSAKKNVGDFSQTLPTKAIQDFTQKAVGALSKGLGDVSSGAKDAGKAVSDLNEKVSKFNSTPMKDYVAESPAPLALGLSQINKEMKRLSAQALPQFQGAMMTSAAMNPVMSMGSVAGGSTTNRSTTINMGGITVQDAMTMNEFNFRVERAILSGSR